MRHCENEGKGKITEGPGYRQPLLSLSPENRGPLASLQPFLTLILRSGELGLWLILKIQNESRFSIYQRRRLIHLPPGSEGPWDNSQWGMRELEVRVHCSPQEHLDKVRGGWLHPWCLLDHPGEVSSHTAGEMGLQSDAPGGCGGGEGGCRLREGGWGSTRINCTPKISPGRRLRELPTAFTADVLFMKLSHSSRCFTVTQHVETGNEGHTQKQGLTHPQAGDTLGPAWLSRS